MKHIITTALCISTLSSCMGPTNRVSHREYVQPNYNSAGQQLRENKTNYTRKAHDKIVDTKFYPRPHQQEVAHPNHQAPSHLVSTIGLDADTGSYHLAMQHIQSGRLPKADYVRSEEFINAGIYQYPKPEDNDLAINHSIVKTGTRRYLLRVGIQAREDHNPTPKRITLVVDTSGSMNSERRLEACQHALKTLIQFKNPNDQVAIVRYSRNAEILQPYTSNKRALIHCIDKLKCGGSSNLEAGVQVAFQNATEHFNKQYMHSIILCSDGIANVGKRKAQDILKRVKSAQLKGINLFTIGVGQEAYNDELMEQLANNGNGTYHYLSCKHSRDWSIGQSILNELHIVAFNTKSQIQFNDQLVQSARLMGYQNRKLANHEFYDERIDGADIPANQSVTVLYELYTKTELNEFTEFDLGQIGLRWQRAFLADNQELNHTISIDTVYPDLKNADPQTQLSWVLGTFAKTLHAPHHNNWHTLTKQIDHMRAQQETPQAEPIFRQITAAARLANPRYHYSNTNSSNATRW